MKADTQSTKTVLITGASTGIGEDAAIYLAEKGFRVLAGVRRIEDGEALKAKSGGKLDFLILDVTKAEQIKAAVQKVEAVGGIDVLVNNAGIAVAGPLELLPLDKFKWQFEVNVFGLLAMTQAFIPFLRNSKGRVINVGSISGKVATPFTGAYSASKFAVEALSDTLRMELSPWGIHVSLIEPGPIKTPIWEKSASASEASLEKLGPEVAELYGPRLKKMKSMVAKLDREISIPVSNVTRVIHLAITSTTPKTRYAVGSRAQIQSIIGPFIPDRLMDKMILSQFQ